MNLLEELRDLRIAMIKLEEINPGAYYELLDVLDKEKRGER